jgi:hypothetical protein
MILIWIENNKFKRRIYLDIIYYTCTRCGSSVIVECKVRKIVVFGGDLVDGPFLFFVA